VPNPVEAVFNCNVYGDERDTILARWNFLQAHWGIGKGKYSFSEWPIFSYHIQ
jgi:nuclear pore complex protein Nup54